MASEIESIDQSSISSSPAIRPASFSKPELLAPAGDRDCLLAAIEHGADAVYFGLKSHNARARAENFSLDEIPQVMQLLHERGMKGYLALNTLVFPAELQELERILRRVIADGVDGIIVQDLGLCRLIRALSPDVEIHASTQMSVTCEDGMRLALELGCSRVILARELSLRDIARVRQNSTLPLEVFVHGALCVAYSGQCLTSEALGGRSANRGECAQACRMPYEIVCDGKDVDLGAIKYLLSPQDLAAFDVVPKLLEIGVTSLKIEGRLKSALYVAAATRTYRQAIDLAVRGQAVEIPQKSLSDMELTFSRGFSHGFLDGTNHKSLVIGEYAKKRGIFLGRVQVVLGDQVRLNLSAPVKPGDGVVFDGDESAGVPEQGGRVYEARRVAPKGKRSGNAGDSESISAGLAELRFGRRDINLSQLRPGQKVWKTDDPELNRRLRSSIGLSPRRRSVALDLAVRAVSGEPLSIRGETSTGKRANVQSRQTLEPAAKLPSTEELLREQLGRLGGTPFHLGKLEATLEGGPLVPRSLLNELRRGLVEALLAETQAGSSPAIASEPVLPVLRQELKGNAGAREDAVTSPLVMSVLCRQPAQAIAAVEAGSRTIYLDFQDIRDYAGAIDQMRGADPGIAVFLATPRIQKPGEGGIMRYLAKQGADGLLVRHCGGLYYAAELGVPFVVDFSLNAANELSVQWLAAKGALRVTASYDLSMEQLDDLLAAVPPEWLEIVIHQHIPMFHMEHCVFCAFLSPGSDKTNCGRPCDRHEVTLRDRVGMEHPLTADVGCRNTLFNAVSQSAAEFLPRLRERGVRHVRGEFLNESPEVVGRVLGLYVEVLEGRKSARDLWKELKATSLYGVTRGQLAVL